MYFSRKANGWDLETFIFIQYSRFSSSLIICYVVQALESMQEKGMQNDPRYPQLMAMANKASSTLTWKAWRHRTTWRVHRTGAGVRDHLFDVLMEFCSINKLSESSEYIFYRNPLIRVLQTLKQTVADPHWGATGMCTP